jgi:hypothetical protein
MQDLRSLISFFTAPQLTLRRSAGGSIASGIPWPKQDSQAVNLLVREWWRLLD